MSTTGIIKISENGFDRFCHICTDTEQIRSGYFINQEISETIMKRTQLQNIYLKLRTIESKLVSTNQWNYFVTLLRKVKKEYYDSLDLKDITVNKKFWKTLKPLFYDK